MSNIRFFSDSTIDLPEEILHTYGIHTLPLHVMMDDHEYLDGVEITAKQLYEYAHRTKRLPKTSAVEPEAFHSAFAEALDEGCDGIIYSGLSGALSATYSNACLARAMLADEGRDARNIHIIDSSQLSTGIAQLMLYGVERAQDGMDAKAVADSMTALLPRIRSSFIVDTLLYLHMGGRCSSLQYIASNMLRIHPQINVTDGKLIPGDRFRGNQTYAIRQYFERVVEKNLESIDPKRIFITHTCEPEQVQAARVLVEQTGYFQEIIETQAGATIASHCGPGTLGFLFIKKV